MSNVNVEGHDFGFYVGGFETAIDLAFNTLHATLAFNVSLVNAKIFRLGLTC